LIKNYSKPFSPDNQDALSKNDYIFTHFVKGEIVPLN
jgi:branched-chain amino acid transport system substrate-binding protein